MASAKCFQPCRIGKSAKPEPSFLWKTRNRFCFKERLPNPEPSFRFRLNAVQLTEIPMGSGGAGFSHALACPSVPQAMIPAGRDGPSEDPLGAPSEAAPQFPQPRVGLFSISLRI